MIDPRCLPRNAFIEAHLAKPIGPLQPPQPLLLPGTAPNALHHASFTVSASTVAVSWPATISTVVTSSLASTKPGR